MLIGVFILLRLVTLIGEVLHEFQVLLYLVSLRCHVTHIIIAWDGLQFHSLYLSLHCITQLIIVFNGSWKDYSSGHC